MSKEQEPQIPRAAQQAILAIEHLLQGLEGAGDARTLEYVAQHLGTKYVGGHQDLRFDLSAQRIARSKDRIPRVLKELAEQNRCGFESTPPYVRFGCVTLKNTSGNDWHLTVFDTYRVQSLTTSNGQELGRACLRVVEEIEQTLLAFRDPLRDLEQAADLIQDFGMSSQEVPLNLLMIMMPFGRNVKRALVNPAGVQRLELSRAAFGFVVAHALRKDGERQDRGPRWRLRQATQHDTKHDHRFIPVPLKLEPRTQTAFRHAISIVSQKEAGSDVRR